MNCASQCGNCVNNAVCDKTDGRCAGVCAAGWRNDRCDEGEQSDIDINSFLKVIFNSEPVISGAFHSLM